MTEADVKETPPFSGPVEAVSWPETIRARVTTPGARPRVHGYDVEGDLAKHYRYADLMLLTLTGELPAPEAALAFEVASMFLAPISVAEAPTHATVLARISGASVSSALGVAALALGEQARFLLDRHVDLLAWLNAPNETLPVAYSSEDSEDAAAVDRLRTALAPTGISVRALELRPTRLAAVFAVLCACGLKRREHLETVLVWARLPAVIAEFLAERPLSFTRYPMNLPHYRYQEAT